MKVLITGATGFLGSYLARALVAQGHEVRALKRPTSNLYMLADVADRIHWYDGDVTDILSLEDAMEGVDHVYHIAALLAFGGRSFDRMLKINVEGTANVVNVALAQGVKKLLFTSSITALGKSKNNSVLDESGDWAESPMESEYGHTKYLAELEIWRGIAEGLDAVIVNPSTILGAGKWDDGSIQIIHQVAKGVPFYPTGSNGFVDVRDVVKACIQLMESDISGERFIINGTNATFLEVMTMLAQAFGQKPPTIPVTDFWKTISIGYDKVRSLITGSEPIITREVLSISSHPYAYNDDKLRQAIGIQYLPLQQTIQESVAAYQQSQKEGKGYGVLGLDYSSSVTGTNA